MFSILQRINRRPATFEKCTTAELWTDEHTSSRMLAFHLDPNLDVSSRNFDFVERSAAWIVTHFALQAGKSVADLGCGPGLYTTRFARSGAHATGVDFSDRSIHYARQQAMDEGISAEYLCCNYLEFQPSKRFDLVTMIMCDFCALSPEQRSQLLDRVRTFLEPGGAFLFDVYSLHGFEARQEQASYAANLLDGFWSSEPYFGFLNTFKYPTERVVLDKFTIVQEERTRTLYNWLQYFDRDSLSTELESAGFQVEVFLGDVAGAAFDPQSTEFAVIARLNSG